MEQVDPIDCKLINRAIRKGLLRLQFQLDKTPGSFNEQLYQKAENHFQEIEVDLLPAGILMWWIQCFQELIEEIRIDGLIPVEMVKALAMYIYEPISKLSPEIDRFYRDISKDNQ